MNAGPMILIPRPIPPGHQVQTGDKTAFPTCDRCRRTSSDRNPVMLTERKSWTPEHYDRKRSDAICYECRLAMMGRY